MTVALNPLSGKLIIFILLGFFPQALSCSFIWSIFLCLLSVSDFCLTFCVVSMTEAVVSVAGTFSEVCLCSHLGRVGLIQSSACARGCSLVGRA